jgi:branched-chain amino acid transport system permease protein
MTKGDGNAGMGPMRYRIKTGTRASTMLSLAGAALVLIFAALPAFAGRGLIQDLIFVFYMLALAQCWNLLAGYAGLVSVGQQAFVGLGGYLLFALTIGARIDPILAIVLAGFSRVTSFPLFFRGLGAAQMVCDPLCGKPVEFV